MNLTTRLLPPGEWPRLSGTELESVWPALDPARAMVLCVEEDGRIVGTWALIHVIHAEGVWIAPDRRQGGEVARKLWVFMRMMARALSARVVATAALSDDVRALLNRPGVVKLPGDHYTIEIGE